MLNEEAEYEVAVLTYMGQAPVRAAFGQTYGRSQTWARERYDAAAAKMATDPGFHRQVVADAFSRGYEPPTVPNAEAVGLVPLARGHLDTDVAAMKAVVEQRTGPGWSCEVRLTITHEDADHSLEWTALVKPGQSLRAAVLTIAERSAADLAGGRQ
ncbi:hypothetical protein [Streptomyces chryseus]|uniref:hypothetical protein n=2 Tax=Streptomyces chryseus TaxID=68186 RepID=UPI0016775E54|nr:hypothetical protein [Streptomyces chryseus]